MIIVILHKKRAIIARFQDELADRGYKYPFITLVGIHGKWFNMYDLAYNSARGEGLRHDVEQVQDYVEQVQGPEFAAREKGRIFVSSQQEVGAGYFDDVTTVFQGGTSTVTALTGSTEEEQLAERLRCGHPGHLTPMSPCRRRMGANSRRATGPPNSASNSPRALGFFDADGREVFRTEGYLKAFHIQGALDHVSTGTDCWQPRFQRSLAPLGEALNERGIQLDIME